MEGKDGTTKIISQCKPVLCIWSPIQTHYVQNTLTFAFPVFSIIINCLTNILLTQAENYLQFLFFLQFPIPRNSTFPVSFELHLF